MEKVASENFFFVPQELIESSIYLPIQNSGRPKALVFLFTLFLWCYYLSLFRPKNKNNNQNRKSSYHSDFQWNHFFFRESCFLPVQVLQKAFVSWITGLPTLPHTDPQPD